MKYSTDGETFNEDSLEDMIADYELKVGDTIWFGEEEWPDISEFLSADSLIDDMRNRAYDQLGEIAEEWPSVSKVAEAELDALLSVWAAKHCPVTFWIIPNPQSRALTAEDFQP